MTSVNAKATLAPPRYKEGEAPPLPKWPINWSCVGMCIETLLSIDPATLVEKVNEMRPTYSMAIVDAGVMTLEEMAIDPPTNLGLKLKAAKAIGDSNWLTPQLVSEVFEARSILDKDDEHRREFQRRIVAAEICKKNIEEALVQEAEAKQQFEASLLQLKDLEDKEKEARELTKQNPNIIAVAMVANLPTKEKTPPRPAKGAPPPTPASGSTEEKKLLEDKTTKLRALLQCYETKVKVAQYWDVKGDSEKDDPMTTTRIYWCVGFGSSVETLFQQVTVKNIFQAIFNLSKKPPPPLLQPKDEVALKIPETIKSGDVPNEPTPLPPLIQELLALKLISKLDHPSRKLPIINVLYEDPPPLEKELEDTTTKIPSKAVGGSSSKKPTQSTGGLPYEQIAKAVIDATISLKQQVESFFALEANISEKCTIPEAEPSKDVDMTYYKELLDEVPKNLLSIPIIVHCMVAQVSIYECSSEDLKTIKVAKANKHLAKGLQNTFQKLGQGLSCMCKPYEILSDLMERIEMQVPEEIAQKALQTSNLSTLETNKKVEKTTTNALRAPSIPIDEKISIFPNNLERKESSLEMHEYNNLSKIGPIIFEQQLSKLSIDSIPQDPKILLAINEVATISDDVSQISELSEGSSTKTQEGEEHLMIVHEFHRVERLEARKQQQILEFWDSIDAIKVEKFMLSLLASPGKNRAYMPISPFLTEEKRHECLEALKIFAKGGSQTSEKENYPMYKELDNIYGPPVILEILEDLNGPSFSLVPVNIAAIQRYRKLKLFLEMLLKEQKRAFNALDTEIEETPSKNICSKDEEIEVDDGLFDWQRKKLEKEKYLVDCGCPGVKIYRYPPPPPESNLSSKSMASSKSTTIFPLFQKILNRNLIELIPNGLLGEIYGRARIHLPYRVQRYDRDDDSLLEALYADERDHKWEGIIASEMGFGDFVANVDSPLQSTIIDEKHATYDIEQRDGIILEHFRCHLTEDQGLVWTGLPAKSNIQWEPQTSIIKDGNMILLRGYGPNDNSNSPTTKSIFAILRDGLIVCFFIAEDGTMNLQITNLENKTIEINSMGVISIFPSERFAQQKPDESTIEEETPINNSIEKETLKDNPKKAIKEIIKETPKEIPKDNEGDMIDENKDNRISNIQSIKDILLQEEGDTEAWRCILPTGTVIRYKDNGDAQILCRQGNVSNWRGDSEGGACWITTNNKGFLVVQRDPLSEEKNALPLKVTNDLDIQLEEIAKPILTQLPKLKVVHLYDPDTKDEIMTREDLVVVVTCEEQHSQLVQHADGTHIYTEVSESFPLEPVEVVIPPKHIYDWPTSCPKDEVSMVEEEDIFKTQDFSKDDTTKTSNVIEDKGNIIESFEVNEIGEANGIHAKPKIVKNIGDSKNKIEGGYGKKKPLRGLLAQYPTKIGIKLSKFAEAQKKHSQTWALEGYGEAPKDIPDWVWPPQPPGHCQERYSTPPLEEISMSIEHKFKKTHFSTLWHMRKDGFAKVHGKIGCGTCIEFTTEDGHYVATWSKENSQLTLTMPGGATLHSLGNIVIYKSFSTSNKHDDAIEIENSTKKKDFIHVESSIQKVDLTQIKYLTQKKDTTQLKNSTKIEDLTQIDDSNIESTIIQPLNTYGAYAFDVLEGSLIFTNNMGTGFKVFGRGCDFESITNGKLASQIEKKAENLQKSFLKSFIIEVEKSPNDNDSNKHNSNIKNNVGDLQQSIKNFEESLKIATKGCDLERSLEINLNTLGKKKSNKLKLMTKEGQQRKPFDPFDGFDLEPPRTWKPTPTPTPIPLPSEPLEPITLGPFPRLFVIQDGGYGYEILANEMYGMYEIAKSYNKYCTKNDDNRLVNGEDCIVHTFVTNEEKSKMTLNELLKDEEKMQTSFPITPWLLTRRISQFARRFQAKQRNNKVQYQTNCDWLQLEFMFPNLPHIINPIVPKFAPEVENTTFVYRQILETPTISEETCKNIDKILEAYADWLLKNIDVLGYDIGLDTRFDYEIEREKFIAQRMQKKLSEKEVQKAQKQHNIQVQDARRIIRKKLRESAQNTFELNQQQRLLQYDIDEDWKVFVESKGGLFQCMHKPTDLLQRKPPFRPLPNIRFLFFHAEEGLRYLFICQQKENEAKQWSIETMSPSPKSSIQSNEDFQNLTKSEEKELANMFSRMIGKVEEMSKEVLKAKEDEKKRKEGENFCKQVFSEVLIPKDPFHDFTAEQSSSDEDEQCIFDYPPKPEKKTKLRPLYVYEFCPTLSPFEPSSIPPSPLSPPSPPPVPLPPLPQALQESPKLKIVPLSSPIEPLEIPINERNKLARDAWHAQRMVEKAKQSKILDPNWNIPDEFDYDYEIYMRAKAFKKAFRNAPWKSNEFYMIRELPNERQMQVQSYERMKLAHDPLPSEWINRQFRIFPPIIDFHIVQLGTMRMKIVVVQNYHGPRSGRIFIHNEDNLSIKFHYFHGLIAPGMYTMLRVYFRASKLGVHQSKAEIVTEADVYSITIKAFVISGVAPPDPDDQIEEIVQNPCDEPIDPWGALILCRRCLTHHLHWWSKNWGLYECTKCWHFHITQEWLDAIAEKARQKRLQDEAQKANR